MNRAYLVGHGELRNGLALIKISELRTFDNYQFLLDVYRELVNISAFSTDFAKAFCLYETWAINTTHIRNNDNFCLPPTDEDLQNFNKSLTEKVNVGTPSGRNVVHLQRIPNADSLFSMVNKFWKWVWAEIS